jgi:hypothetical protein
VALRALLDAVRLGDIRAADAIERVSTECDCVVGRLAQAHGRAVVRRDSAALRDVSKRYAAVGMKRAAADATAQADDM